MNRDPSLHITKSDLIKVLNELTYTQRTTGTKLAEMIFNEGSQYQLTDRYLKILQLTAKVRKKVEKSMEADDVPAGTVEKFNLLLIAEREKQNNYVKAKPISKSNPQYQLLKEVAKMAYDFVQHFEITPQSDGFKEYIQLGLKFMRKYGLNRFKTYDAQIYEVFESKIKVYTDPHAEYTERFYVAWQDAMHKHTNMAEETNIKSDTVKYSNMVYGREAADELEAYYEDWIEAQFDQLQFLNAIPELVQFYGENAKKRWERYMKQESALPVEEGAEDVRKIYDEG